MSEKQKPPEKTAPNLDFAQLAGIVVILVGLGNLAECLALLKDLLKLSLELSHVAVQEKLGLVINGR